MFDNVVLQVSIGLAFIYALYSLFTTIINEMIASLFSLRARTLGKALKRMLTDSEKSPLEQKLLDEFLKHPLIKYMSSGVFHKRPSYISPESFSKALTDVLKGIDAIEPEESLRKINEKLNELGKKGSEQGFQSDTLILIYSFLRDAGGSIEKFKMSLEKWFNDMMERTSGWYKRKTQVIVLAIGIILSIGFNVNTIEIVNRLAKDKTAREEIVQISENYVKDRLPYARDTTVSGRLDMLVFRADSLYKADVEKANEVVGIGWNSWNEFTSGFWKSLIGCLITALAISLGAPFWFDLLH